MKNRSTGRYDCELCGQEEDSSRMLLFGGGPNTEPHSAHDVCLVTMLNLIAKKIVVPYSGCTP